MKDKRGFLELPFSFQVDFVAYRINCNRWRKPKSGFLITSKHPPTKCLNKTCNKAGKIVLDDIEYDDKPFVEAENKPPEPWGEIQKKVRPPVSVDFLPSNRKRNRLV